MFKILMIHDDDDDVGASARPPYRSGWGCGWSCSEVLPFFSCAVPSSKQCCSWCSDALWHSLARFCSCSGGGWCERWRPEEETHVDLKLFLPEAIQFPLFAAFVHTLALQFFVMNGIPKSKSDEFIVDLAMPQNSGADWRHRQRPGHGIEVLSDVQRHFACAVAVAWWQGKIPNEIQGSVKFVNKVVAYQEGQKGNSV